jgi:ATP-dependent RNA helicase RhlE
MSFESLGLSAALVRALTTQGYTTPTPIQAQVIPAVLEGRDIIACARTGTGKTAAFALPLLERLAGADAAHAAGPGRGPRRIRVLVLSPTRELAVQIEQSVRAYGAHLPLRSTTVYGGVSASRQVAELRRGVDVLVATPGRLLDHLSQRAVDLSGVETVVLDEADRMLDMGFLPAIRSIMKALPRERQTLLFSATLEPPIRTLAEKMLTNPARIDVTSGERTVDEIEQFLHRVDKTEKRATLARLIRNGDWQQVLVFTRTKHGANRLAQQLDQDGLRAAAIHGNKSQAARAKALAQFKQGSVAVLVATDVAARGIDIDQLPHVVNFDLPDVPEHYVHRIGRTGRAGRRGVALSLVSGDERGLLQGIERFIGRRIPVRDLPFTGGAAPQKSAPQAAMPARDRHARRRPGTGGNRPESRFHAK